MTTLGTMLTRISSEINRTDIDNNIYDAVISAIAFYEHQEFYFNQAVWTLTTTANQRYTYLTGISDFLIPIVLRVTDTASQYRVLDEKPYSEIESKYISDSSTGRLYEYSVFAERFWWWLIPDSAYTVNVSYIKQLTRPTSISDTTNNSAWFSDGEAMIRSKAKSYIYADTLRKTEEAAKFQTISDREFFQLKEKTRKRSFNPRLRGFI